MSQLLALLYGTIHMAAIILLALYGIHIFTHQSINPDQLDTVTYRYLTKHRHQIDNLLFHHNVDLILDTQTYYHHGRIYIEILVHTMHDQIYVITFRHQL